MAFPSQVEDFEGFFKKLDEDLEPPPITKTIEKPFDMTRIRQAVLFPGILMRQES